jgi:hypothetical protein
VYIVVKWCVGISEPRSTLSAKFIVDCAEFFILLKLAHKGSVRKLSEKESMKMRKKLTIVVG